MSVKTGLGKGLEALIPKEFDSVILDSGEKVQNIAINRVEPNPDQPRKHFDDDALDELTKSIKSHGIIQPLVVTKNGDNYQIVAGERRWRAAQNAKLKEVPAIVRSLQKIEELEVSIIENVQRVDLTPLEQAVSIERLHDQFSLSYSEIAQKLGKAVPTIHNLVRLLQLPEKAKKALIDNKITEGHARAILALRDFPDQQGKLLESVLKFGWSVRQAEQFVVAIRDNKKTAKIATKYTSAKNEFTKKMSKILDTDVSLKRTAKGGKIEIYFKNEDDLSRIIDKISH
jgi:ParB family chromosome partitioning protein